MLLYTCKEDNLQVTRKGERRAMNMSEAARMITGLRAVGWDEKDINVLFSLSRPEKSSTSQKKKIKKEGRETAPTE